MLNIFKKDMYEIRKNINDTGNMIVELTDDDHIIEEIRRNSTVIGICGAVAFLCTGKITKACEAVVETTSGLVTTLVAIRLLGRQLIKWTEEDDDVDAAAERALQHYEAWRESEGLEPVTVSRIDKGDDGIYRVITEEAKTLD